MTAKPILVIAAGERVVTAVCCVCGNFRGLYIFPSLVLVAFDCGITERWVLANSLAGPSWKVVDIAFVECFGQSGNGWREQSCMHECYNVAGSG